LNYLTYEMIIFLHHINISSMNNKKNLKSFQHAEIDSQSQKYWMDTIAQESCSEQELTSDKKDNNSEFRMILPPPNITGTLHLGHALNITIQDMMSRYNRMIGKKVTWIPGVDHAGIATQVIVEKQLMKESNQTRHNLGREQFLEKIWEWKDRNSTMIQKQLQVMCPYINYNLEQFTMSSELSRGVTDAFIKLYNMGLIYRDLRMVDYCCELKTVISNIEIEEIEIKEPPLKYKTPRNVNVDLGIMYEIAYLIVNTGIDMDQKITKIIVSTTRPETIFGDVAVAVNPLDPRYQGLEGTMLQIPLSGRTIPLIYDEMATIGMGTGAVKITPCHDQKDWDTYLRRKDDYKLIDPINVIDDDGMIVYDSVIQSSPDQFGFNGKDRYICRSIILKKLNELGYLVASKPHKQTIKICSRSNDILEPRLKHQWYVDTKDMSRKSINAVESGELKITPDHDNVYAATWKRFLSEEQPWCISRQLWWGHRIPAYKMQYKQMDNVGDDRWIIAESLDLAKDQAKIQYPTMIHGIDYTLTQDEDVLDTWFSSGIYPFTILNKKYFPYDILETGKDILFFWVARMVMLSLTLTDTLPFKTIYLHNVIYGKDGKKMSKSRGNVIDPFDIIYGISKKDMDERIKTSNLLPKEKTEALANNNKFFPNGIADYGVDTLRLGLVYYLRQGTDISIDPGVFKSAHALLNKIWNIMQMYLHYHETITKRNGQIKESDNNMYTNYCTIISEVQEYINIIKKENLKYEYYENNDFSKLYDNIYKYIMDNYCPFYLEVIKFIFIDPMFLDTILEKNTLEYFKSSLLEIIVYLHPICPNITHVMIPMIHGLSERQGTEVPICDYSKFMNHNNGIKNKIDAVRSKIHEINSSVNKHSMVDGMYGSLISFMTR
jgi:valyl-tRNA synthetase